MELLIPSEFMMTRLFLTLAVLSISPALVHAEDEPQADPVASSLGATGAQAVLSTFFALSELADLYGSEVYDKEKTTQLASMFAGTSASVNKSLTELIASDKLSKENNASIQEMVVINELLSKMANGIKEIVADPSDANEAAYQKNRETTWKAISKFLALKD
jgi:hypothetical protein